MEGQRIAFVHDWIYHIGGAESVFFTLIDEKLKKEEQDRGKVEIVDAVIFTLFSDKKTIGINGYELEIVTALPCWIFSIFQYFDQHKIVILSTLFDYRNLMFFYPLLVAILRCRIMRFAPDEVIVSSFAAAKNIVNPKLTTKNKSRLKKEEIIGNKLINDDEGFVQTLGTVQTTLYLHSPMQYIWDYYEDNVHKLRFPIKQFYQFITPFLRRWDKQPREYDMIYYNSNYTKQCAQKLYGWTHGDVKYPPLDPRYLQAQIHKESDYYIFIGRLVRFAKELDLIIRVFNHTGDRLKIVGSGPDEQYLRSIAKDNIEFVGHISDVQDKIRLVGQSRGLINLTRESFGMVTAEALCLGVAVFAYYEGGSAELVDENSGVLINDKKLDYVIKQFEQFKQQTWDRQKIQQRIREML